MGQQFNKLRDNLTEKNERLIVALNGLDCLYIALFSRDLICQTINLLAKTYVFIWSLCNLKIFL